MTNFSRSHIGCRDSLQVSISTLYKCGYPSNVSCNKLCNVVKIRSMAINGIPLGYVNNYEKNRYLEKNSKAAVCKKYQFRISKFINITFIFKALEEQNTYLIMKIEKRNKNEKWNIFKIACVFNLTSANCYF